MGLIAGALTKASKRLHQTHHDAPNSTRTTRGPLCASVMAFPTMSLAEDWAARARPQDAAAERANSPASTAPTAREAFFVMGERPVYTARGHGAGDRRRRGRRSTATCAALTHLVCGAQNSGFDLILRLDGAMLKHVSTLLTYAVVGAIAFSLGP